MVRDPNFFPIRAFLHRQLVRLETCVGTHLPGSGAEIPADARAQQRKLQRERTRRNERERERREQKRNTTKH